MQLWFDFSELLGEILDVDVNEFSRQLQEHLLFLTLIFMIFVVSFGY